MILEILQKLERAEAPMAGDDDIRHGCERALTALMVDLARIPAAPPGKLSKADLECIEWLQSEQAVRLINADLLQRMHQFIHRILGEDRHSE